MILHVNNSSVLHICAKKTKPRKHSVGFKARYCVLLETHFYKMAQKNDLNITADVSKVRQSLLHITVLLNLQTRGFKPAKTGTARVFELDEF